MKIGNVELTADPQAASTEYAFSLSGWLALPAAEQSAVSTRRGIAQTHIKIAAAAAAVDDYPKAQTELDLAAPTLEYLAKADAADSRVTYDLASFYLERAFIYVDQIDTLNGATQFESRALAIRAMELVRRAIPILERLETMEPDNRSWVANLARARVALGSFEIRFFRMGLGASQTKLGLSTLRNIARLPDASIDVLETAVRADLEAEPVELRKSDQTVKFAQRLVGATGRRNPEHLWLLARVLGADHQPAAADETVTQALALLPDIPDGSRLD